MIVRPCPLCQKLKRIPDSSTVCTACEPLQALYRERDNIRATYAAHKKLLREQRAEELITEHEAAMKIHAIAKEHGAALDDVFNRIRAYYRAREEKSQTATKHV